MFCTSDAVPSGSAGHCVATRPGDTSGFVLEDYEHARARGAKFVAAAAVVVPGRLEDSVLGEWPGTILRSARGEGGFGVVSLSVGLCK